MRGRHDADVPLCTSACARGWRGGRARNQDHAGAPAVASEPEQRRAGMTGFLLRRLAMAVIVLFGVAAIVFFALFLTGDPAALMLPPDAGRAEIVAFRHAMGFDQPVAVQFLHYLANVLRGDFGTLAALRPARAGPDRRTPPGHRPAGRRCPGLEHGAGLRVRHRRRGARGRRGRFPRPPGGAVRPGRAGCSGSAWC